MTLNCSPGDGELCVVVRKVICYLKEDQSEFLEDRRLKDLEKKYSEFIGFSIELYVEKSKKKEVNNSKEDEQHLVAEFKQSQDIDLTNDKLAVQRLREAAETAKIELARRIQTDIKVPFITAVQTGSKHLQVSLTIRSSGGLSDRNVEKMVQEARFFVALRRFSWGAMAGDAFMSGVCRVGPPTVRPLLH